MAQKDSALFRLPLELREQIYSQAFTCASQHGCYLTHGLMLTLIDSKIYKPWTYTPHTSGSTSACGKTSLSLLRTCKLINREAAEILHQAVEVRLHVDGRYRSPVEIKGVDLGDIENLSWLRNARVWNVTVRLNSKEDVGGLVEQLSALGGVVEREKRRVTWRRLSVQVSRYNEAPEYGQRVLRVLREITGVEELYEVRDQWREGTTVFDYQASGKC